MTEAEKKGFRTVQQTDMEEYHQKLKEHRWKVFRRTIIVAFLLLILVTGISLYMSLRKYEDFDIRSSVDRSDTAATVFEEFQGNILKYSNDGATYTSHSNEMIWNQTYEMSNPAIDICEGYLTIYDKKGTDIYILTANGLVGSIETTMPISQVSIANQGTIAVLMDNQSAGYLALYDKKGNALASGAIHGEKGGYPIAIALSNDAIKLAVSILDINDGNVKTTVAFYNFGTVGENEIDHIVAANSFSDTIIPELDFVSGERMIAFGDSEITIFEGTQKPKAVAQISFTDEAKSVFHNEKYIGVVYKNREEATGHHVCIYDMRGSLMMEKDFSMEYSRIELLSNNELCISDATTCDIYTTRGIYKFHYEFDTELYRVIAGSNGLNYTFILNGITQQVRLK